MSMKVRASEKGYFGAYGGAFVPEMLRNNIRELQDSYRSIIEDENFQKEYRLLLRDYVGRPTPLYYAKNLSKHYNCRLFLKREDLNHTGAHKINNTIGQILLAKSLGKKRIIAETGAGQHGVATATVCALMDFPCTVFMGELDIERQKPNVEKMKMLGATVHSVTSGSKVLKDATNEAIRDWICNPKDTHYIIGSAVGPHPFPDMVAYFQSIISEECKEQLKSQCEKENPDYVVACIGGGSNAIGTFYHYLNDETVKLVGVEAAGHGIDTEKTAATLKLGTDGILHGSKTVLLQTQDGQVKEAHSVSAGLDYPGVGPQHAFLCAEKRVQYVSVTDVEALEAALIVTKKEGIIPALETAHAFAYLEKLETSSKDVVVLCLSGRGDKDNATYLNYIAKL